MNILGIETSCDETSIAVVKATGDLSSLKTKTLSHSLNSQIDIHARYGGVFPTEAKRAHAKNIVPILAEALEKSGLENTNTRIIPQNKKEELRKVLEREPELFERLIIYAETVEKPDIDMISVTVGPGLPPALWVGVNFAKALNILWDIPVIGANHMEGHILSVLLNETEKIEFPTISLLISGGHTELVLMKDIENTEKIGETRDDAIGEAFDKTARMLGLPYPGGPEISKLAKEHRVKFPVCDTPEYPLPRPMIYSDDFDFSFSGIKTAVLYTTRKIENISESQKQSIAREFEDAVTEVIIKKTEKALSKYGAKSLIIGGGVIANIYIRSEFKKLTDSNFVKLHIPDLHLATDNAVMIAVAGYRKYLSTNNFDDPQKLKADSGLEL